MAGFPGRSNRLAYGDPFQDVLGGQTDPRRSVTAAQMNLYAHQLGGFGMMMPLVIFHGSCGDAGSQGCDFLRYAFATASGLATPGTRVAYDTITYVDSASSSSGELTITFDSTVPDIDGNSVALAFTGGVAVANVTDPAARSELELVTSQQVRIRVYDFATGSDIADSDVTVALW